MAKRQKYGVCHINWHYGNPILERPFPKLGAITAKKKFVKNGGKKYLLKKEFKK